jgi:hypothetical protein
MEPPFAGTRRIKTARTGPSFSGGSRKSRKGYYRAIVKISQYGNTGCVISLLQAQLQFAITQQDTLCHPAQALQADELRISLN